MRQKQILIKYENKTETEIETEKENEAKTKLWEIDKMLDVTTSNEYWKSLINF